MDCGYCKDLSPQLGKLPEERPQLVLFSHGDLDAHRELAEQDKWDCDVVIEDDVGCCRRVPGGRYAVGLSRRRRRTDRQHDGTRRQALLELLEATPIAPPELSGSGNGHGGTG